MLASWIPLLLAVSIQSAEDLPRYQLRSGLKLFTESEGEGTSQGSKSTTSGTTEITILQKCPDGAFWVLMRGRVRIDFGADFQIPEQQRWAWFRLWPDGAYEPNESTDQLSIESASFPRLPNDPTDLEKGWTSPVPGRSRTVRYEIDDSESGDWTLRATASGPLMKVFEQESKATLRFDRERGLIAESTLEFSQGEGIRSRDVSRSRLVKTEQCSAEELTSMVASFDRFLEARVEARQMIRGSEDDDRYDRARSLLEGTRDTLTHPGIRALVEHTISEVRQESRRAKELHEEFGELIGRAAADWKALDLRGRPHSAEESLGSVVVLDFWYRRCGWCIQAMPQVIEIAEHFQDRDVRIFGMNTDPVLEDALYVEELFESPIVHLRASDWVEPFHVKSFPTLLVIDKKGRLRDVHIGYTTDLAEDVIATIERLLQED
ncbi:MAG: TlpA disulfide reductase family protein [Planctomycetota bacterium]